MRLTLIFSLLLSAAAWAQSKIGIDSNYAVDMESKGFSWKKEGQVKDVYSILSEAGFSKARIRLWTGDEGMNGLKYAIDTATRAKKAGLEPYLVIFLSENWSDFVKQPVPALWKDLSYDQKVQAVEAYSKHVAEVFKENGIELSWYEIGNEIDFGICGEFEEAWPNRVSLEYMQAKIWPRMAPIIRAAQAGVKSVNPDAKFILHLTQFQNDSYCTAFWKYMQSQNVQVDFAGISYFPTNGAKPEERSLDYLKKQIDIYHDSLNVPVVICESGYPSSPNFGGQFADWNKPVAGYTMDDRGQANWLANVKKESLSNEKIAAWFYWSPEWAGPGMWEAFAIFDAQGNARLAIDPSIKISPPAATQPSTQPAANINIYFGNLHSHTAVSDGSGTPAEAFAYARDIAKLDFLAITEHNHLMGGDKSTLAERQRLYDTLIAAADESNADEKFVTLYGQEFSSMSKGNHVNVYDIKVVIDVPNGEFGTLLEWIDKHPDTIGNRPVIQLNHPGLGYNMRGIGKNEYGRDDFKDESSWVEKMGAATELIEVLNGEQPRGSTITRSPQMMEDKLNLFLLAGFKVAPVGNQDNHQKTWGTATQTRTGILATRLTRSDILATMRARHVYATEDPNLKIIVRVNGELAGRTIAADQFPAKLKVDCLISDSDEPDAAYSIDAIGGEIGDRDVTVLKNFQTRGNMTSPVELLDLQAKSPESFVYFRITQTSSAGMDRAWIAPVWFSVR